MKNKTRYCLALLYGACSTSVFVFYDEADLTNFIMDLEELKNKPRGMALACNNETEKDFLAQQNKGLKAVNKFLDTYKKVD